MSRTSAVRKSAVRKSAVKKSAAKKTLAKAVKAAKRPVPKTAAPKARKPAHKAIAKVTKVTKVPRPVKVIGRPVTAVAKPPKEVAKPEPVAVTAKIAAPPSRPAAPREEPRYAGLAESDLRHAPVSQYMNAAQLAFFRERLLAMQHELLDKADSTSEHLREHDIEPDPTDQATIEEEYALELRARDRERKLLKKIEQALRRIDDGSYGYCEETGDAIGIPRLLARPTATLSIEAQARRELKQKLYGD